MEKTEKKVVKENWFKQNLVAIHLFILLTPILLIIIKLLPILWHGIELFNNIKILEQMIPKF